MYGGVWGGCGLQVKGPSTTRLRRAVPLPLLGRIGGCAGGGST